VVSTVPSSEKRRETFRAHLHHPPRSCAGASRGPRLLFFFCFLVSPGGGLRGEGGWIALHTRRHSVVEPPLRTSACVFSSSCLCVRFAFRGLSFVRYVVCLCVRRRCSGHARAQAPASRPTAREGEGRECLWPPRSLSVLRLPSLVVACGLSGTVHARCAACRAALKAGCQAQRPTPRTQRNTANHATTKHNTHTNKDRVYVCVLARMVCVCASARAAGSNGVLDKMSGGGEARRSKERGERGGPQRAQRGAKRSEHRRNTWRHRKRGVPRRGPL
jgi:hypothetical protein